MYDNRSQRGLEQRPALRLSSSNQANKPRGNRTVNTLEHVTFENTATAWFDA